MAAINDRKIRDVRDIWNCGNRENMTEAQKISQELQNNNKHKYKTLERHLSMKKTIRRKMMRDLREIGDAAPENNSQNGFLEQIKNDQPPPPNIDKPSLWKRLTKGWGHN